MKDKVRCLAAGAVRVEWNMRRKRACCCGDLRVILDEEVYARYSDVRPRRNRRGPRMLGSVAFKDNVTVDVVSEPPKHLPGTGRGEDLSSASLPPCSRCLFKPVTYC